MDWDEAIRSFILQLRAVRAEKTVSFYDVQLRMLSRWATSNHIALEQFGNRDIEQYLACRAEEGKSQVTLHHDAMCAKVFFRWCSKNTVIQHNGLADYEVRKAPAQRNDVPAEDAVNAVIAAAKSFWDPRQNSDARFNPSARRIFNRDRNYAILMTLLGTTCRIGEILSLKTEDYQASERQITVRARSKSEPHTILVSKQTSHAIAAWLKVRARVMKNVPGSEDSGYLFLSETGGRMDEGRFLKTIKKYADFAGILEKFSLQALHRFSLNRGANRGSLAAQPIAIHKQEKMTLTNTTVDMDYVRRSHEEAGVVRSLLRNEQTARRKRLV